MQHKLACMANQSPKCRPLQYMPALTSAPAAALRPSSTPASSVSAEASRPVGNRMDGSECSR